MTQQTVTFRYVPEVDDLVEFLAESPERRRRRNRALRDAITMLILLCLALWGDSVEPTSDSPLLALFFVAASANYAWKAFTHSSAWHLRRTARAVWKGSVRLRKAHEEEIRPEGLTVRWEGESHTYAWSQFSGFRERDRQFILLDRSGGPVIAMPKRGLPDPALLPVCRTLLTAYVAGASPSTPEANATDGTEATDATDGTPAPAPAGEPGH